MFLLPSLPGKHDSGSSTNRRTHLSEKKKKRSTNGIYQIRIKNNNALVDFNHHILIRTTSSLPGVNARIFTGAVQGKWIAPTGGCPKKMNCSYKKKVGSLSSKLRYQKEITHKIAIIWKTYQTGFPLPGWKPRPIRIWHLKGETKADVMAVMLPR